MRTITVQEAETKFGSLMDAAAREPVTVTREGGDAAVLMSLEAYRRLTGQSRRELLDVMQRMRSQSAANGLDEAKLAELLADDS